MWRNKLSSTARPGQGFDNSCFLCLIKRSILVYIANKSHTLAIQTQKHYSLEPSWSPIQTFYVAGTIFWWTLTRLPRENTQIFAGSGASTPSRRRRFSAGGGREAASSAADAGGRAGGAGCCGRSGQGRRRPIYWSRTTTPPPPAGTVLAAED